MSAEQIDFWMAVISIAGTVLGIVGVVGIVLFVGAVLWGLISWMRDGSH